jgi:predicted GIY-YIG superfamily endonuclease
VYVLSNADGDALYVGKTARGMGRLCNHHVEGVVARGRAG